MTPKKTAARHTLHPYQQMISDATTVGLATGGRAQVLMACGTGKTLTGMRTIETVLAGTPAATVVLAFPNLSLLGQTVTVWRKQSNWRDTFGRADYVAVAVCSDETVGRPDKDDHLAMTVEQAIDHQVTVTTDPDVLTAFLRGHSDRRRVVFATYQSMEVLVSSARSMGTGFAFDFVLADEAHRTAGEACGDDAQFGVVLDDKLVPARRRMFMTATQRVMEGRAGMARGARSMDNLALFGPVTGEFSFKAAIEAGKLTDYQIHVVMVDHSELELVAGTPYADLIRDDMPRARALTTAIAVVKMARKKRLHRVLAFHARVASSQAFTTVMGEVAAAMTTTHVLNRDLAAEHVDGSTPAAERKRVLNHLRNLDATNASGQWSVVSNVGVFTEGIDVPALDAVVLADPRSSEVDVAQIVGRALRLDPKRSHAHQRPAAILVPVLVDTRTADPADALARSAFDAAAQIMRAMRLVDARIVERFTAAHVEALTAVQLPDHGDDDAAEPVGDTTPVASGSRSEPTWQDDGDGGARLQLPGVMSLTAGPEMLDNDATEVDPTPADDKITFVLPGLTLEGMLDLGVERERAAAIVATRAAEWTAADVRRLGRAITTREIDYVLTDWEKTADQVGVFHAAHGRWPSKRATDPEEKRLGQWLSDQRVQAGGGTKAHLFTADRRAYLDKAAPGWDEGQHVAWNVSADRVGAFHRAHGRLPSTEASDPEEKRLGQWLATQRVQAGGGQNARLFTAGRRAYLDQVAPGWDVGRQAVWHSTAAEVGAFYRTHGRWPSTRASDPVEKRLGVWLSVQRVQAAGWHAHLLTADRRVYLDQVAPGWDLVQQVAWNVSADRVVAFHLAHGRWPSQRASDPVEKRLGVWLATQRTQARGGTGVHRLTAERRAYLDKVAPGWGGGREAVWHSTAAQVSAFHRTHGRWPRTSASDPAEKHLGKWLGTQRAYARGGTNAHLFTADHRAYLDQVAPGWLPEADSEQIAA